MIPEIKNLILDRQLLFLQGRPSEWKEKFTKLKILNRKKPSITNLKLKIQIVRKKLTVFEFVLHKTSLAYILNKKFSSVLKSRKQIDLSLFFIEFLCSAPKLFNYTNVKDNLGKLKICAA